MKKYIYIFIFSIGFFFSTAHASGKQIEVTVQNNTTSIVHIGCSWYNESTKKSICKEFTLYHPHYNPATPFLHRPTFPTGIKFNMPSSCQVWVVTSDRGKCKVIDVQMEKGNQVFLVSDILKNGDVGYVGVKETGCNLL